MDNDFEYGLTVIILIVCIFINFFTVATATDQRNKQCSLLSVITHNNVYDGSYKQLQVFKLYISTSIMHIYSFLKCYHFSFMLELIIVIHLYNVTQCYCTHKSVFVPFLSQRMQSYHINTFPVSKINSLNSVNLLVSLTVETQGIVNEITYVTQLLILISFSNKINHILPVYLALCKYDFLVNLSFPRTYRRTHCRMNFYYIEHYPVFKSIHAYCSTTLIHVLPLNYNGMALTFIYAMIYVLYVFLQLPRVNGYSPSWSINLILDCHTCTAHMPNYNTKSNKILLQYKSTYFKNIYTYLRSKVSCNLIIEEPSVTINIMIWFFFRATGTEQAFILMIAHDLLLYMLWNNKITLNPHIIREHSLKKFVDENIRRPYAYNTCTYVLTCHNVIINSEITIFVNIITIVITVAILLLMVLGSLPYENNVFILHITPRSSCTVSCDNLFANLIIYDGS